MSNRIWNVTTWGKIEKNRIVKVDGEQTVESISPTGNQLMIILRNSKNHIRTIYRQTSDVVSVRGQHA